MITLYLLNKSQVIQIGVVVSYVHENIIVCNENKR